MATTKNTTSRNRARDYHSPKSVEDLTQRNVEAILQLEETAREKRTTLDRAVDGITSFCGSLSFVWFHAVWFGLWMIYGLIRKDGFDPFPFQLLTLIVSLEAIFLSTFILISQNRDMQLAERRNHLDLQINLLTEQENTKMLMMLKQIADKVGADIHQDPDVKVLEQATRPDKLVEQIEEAFKVTEPSEPTKNK
jgi:uncharacterized membrane protein